MQTLLAKKQTEEQKRLNEAARYQLMLAVFNMDEKLIQPLLKKDAVFFGNMTAWQVLYWFKSQFNLLPKDGIYSQYKEYISLDYYPGTLNFEFSNGPVEGVFYNYSDSTKPVSLDEIFGEENVIKLKISLLFENGLIADIRIPKREAELKELNRFICQN